MTASPASEPEAVPAPGRIVLGVEYDGSGYYGWQAQKSPQVPTVQQTLEAALSRIARQPITVVCAGRTDSGVHASGQVVHFDTPVARPDKAWVLGSNTMLPGSVRVRWARPVENEFHARFSALSRRYRYVIYNHHIRPALMRNLVAVHSWPLDEKQMARAGQYLVGERDFTSFRGAECQSSTPMRRVKHLDVRRFGEYVVVDVEANAFLLHMVRNIVGVLLEVGEGRRPPEWAGEVLARRDRTSAGVTAPARGLYLAKVTYPARFGLPEEAPGPAFLRPWEH